MDKNELERRLEAAKKQNLGLMDEIKNLKAQLAEMQDEPKIPDIPEQFESPVVWAVDSKLDVFNYGISPYNESSFNAFHTKEMAQEFADKCKLIAMMLHCKWYLCRDYEPEWDDANAEKWQVCYEHGHNRFAAHCVYTYEPSSVFFDTIQDAQKCAEWLNEHWRKNDEESV